MILPLLQPEFEACGHNLSLNDPTSKTLPNSFILVWRMALVIYQLNDHFKWFLTFYQIWVESLWIGEGSTVVAIHLKSLWYRKILMGHQTARLIIWHEFQRSLLRASYILSSSPWCNPRLWFQLQSYRLSLCTRTIQEGQREDSL